MAGKCHVCWILLIGLFKHEFIVTLDTKNMRHPKKTGHTQTHNPPQPCFDGNVPKFPHGRRPCTLQSFDQLRVPAPSLKHTNFIRKQCFMMPVTLEKKWEDFSQKATKEGGDVWIDYSYLPRKHPDFLLGQSFWMLFGCCKLPMPKQNRRVHPID